MAKRPAGSRWGFVLVVLGFMAYAVIWSLKYLRYGLPFFAIALGIALLIVFGVIFGSLFWKRKQWISKRREWVFLLTSAPSLLPPKLTLEWRNLIAPVFAPADEGER
jgi:Na+/proline symporter